MAESFFRRALNQVLRRRGAGPDSNARAGEWSPLGIVEEIHATGQARDYCLYLPPAGSGPWGWDAPKFAAHENIESLLTRAFEPLPMLRLDDAHQKPASGDALPDEVFLLLAEHARVLMLIPSGDARFSQRLTLLKGTDALRRAIFLMPDHGAFGVVDWSASWVAARQAAAAELGMELSAYTAGGWLFRLGQDGRACTFRPIANPNAEKIAKAIEAICVEMDASA